MYEEILHLPHHTSPTRLRMPMSDRSAQFSPFAALSGYDAAVKEAARMTKPRIELDEDEKAILDSKLSLLQKNLYLLPEAAITYFQPDEQKSGGFYRSVTGKVQKIDSYKKCLILENGEKIPAADIIKIDF